MELNKKNLIYLNFKYITFSYLIFVYINLNIIITPATGIGVSDLETTHRSVNTDNSSTVKPEAAKIVEYTTRHFVTDKWVDKENIENVPISTNNKPVEISTPPSGSSTEQKGVWCYCNFPQCVPSGYMCQSEEGAGCFSKSSEEASSSSHSRLYRHLSMDSLTRGCVEFLTKDERHYCETKKKQQTKEQHSDRRTPDGEAVRGSLQCCHQNMCNYEVLSKPIIVREIEESEITLSHERKWFRGITIGVSILGIVVLIFLFMFASRILTAEDKGRSTEFLNEPSSDFYIKVPFYIERGPDTRPTGGEMCSILCVKSLNKNSLQRKQDIADYCRFHPLASSNRHSLSCPSSLAIFPPSSAPDDEKEELQPLRPDLVQDGRLCDESSQPYQADS